MHGAVLRRAFDKAVRKKPPVDGRSLMPQGFDNPAAPFAGGIKPQALYRCAPRRLLVAFMSCLVYCKGGTLYNEDARLGAVLKGR